LNSGQKDEKKISSDEKTGLIIQKLKKFGITNTVTGAMLQGISYAA